MGLATNLDVYNIVNNVDNNRMYMSSFVVPQAFPLSPFFRLSHPPADF